MTAADTPLPETHDGEPDMAAEIARLEADLKSLTDQTKAMADATDYDAISAGLDAMLSEEVRASIPTSGSKMEQLFARVTAAIAENKRNPVVPETDVKRPSLSPAHVDFTTLPAHARIAAGYGKA